MKAILAVGLALLFACSSSREKPDSSGPVESRGDDVLAPLSGHGWKLEQQAVRTPVIGWTPAADGFRITVTDPSRRIQHAKPYSDDVEETARRITLFLFPSQKLSTRMSMVTREQPGNFEGAINGYFVFMQQAAQSGDADDDGKLRQAVLGALFPAGAEATYLKQDGPPGAAQYDAPEEVRAILFRAQQGADVELSVVPR